MLDLVPVDQSRLFTAMEFRGAQPKTQYNPAGNSAGPQKTTANGVPVWAVRVLVEIQRGHSTSEQLLTVSLPMEVNPADKLQRGQAVEFVGLNFGVTPKRDGGGVVTWMSAETVQPAGGGRGAATEN